MAKKINHPFYKVYDTSELHKKNRDLGLSESDLKYEKFVPILVKALQELSAKNDALEARIATLEG